MLTKIISGDDVSTFGNKESWVRMYGKEYYVSSISEFKKQANAQDYCIKKGGTLFEPKSAYVNNGIANLVKETRHITSNGTRCKYV